jgi:hypothetical protein
LNFAKENKFHLKIITLDTYTGKRLIDRVPSRSVSFFLIVTRFVR